MARLGGKKIGGADAAEAADASAQGTAAHTSAEYAEALENVAAILETAIGFVPSGVATGAVGAAKKALPLMRKLAGALPDLAPVVDPLVAQAPEAARAVGDAAARAGGAVADAAGAAAHAVADPVRAGLAARQAERARKEARKAIIAGAATSMPLARFSQSLAAHESLAPAGGTGARLPGCYVILRVERGIGHDLADFADVYVGASDDMWSAVEGELAGYGNPDVYADAKYDAGVHVLMYPCAPEDLAQLRASLVVALDADASYNARELA